MSKVTVQEVFKEWEDSTQDDEEYTMFAAFNAGFQTGKQEFTSEIGELRKKLNLLLEVIKEERRINDHQHGNHKSFKRMDDAIKIIEEHSRVKIEETCFADTIYCNYCGRTEPNENHPQFCSKCVPI